MATNNQDQAVRSYALQFRELLTTVFEYQSYFRDFFGGTIQSLDGVQENEDAFYVKTSDIAVVVGSAYDKDADVGFGTGTGSTSRFGKRTEVIYSNTPAKYAWEWVFHEGIDRFTVNNDFDSAIADRLDLQSQALTEKFNNKHSSFISTVAGKTQKVADIETEAKILAAFNALSAYFTNIRAVGTRVAKVTPELYNAIIDSKYTVREKGSTANIDSNEIVKFKGFVIEETPVDLFQKDEVAYIYVPNIARAFTGIVTTRAINSEDFDGVALQGAGKAGEFILDDNKKAVAKIVIGEDASGGPEA